MRTPEQREHAAVARRGGFALVEAIIAIMILAVGVVGLAGVSGFVTRQLTLSQMTTERAAALRSTIERIRALDFDDVVNGSDTFENMAVSWTVTADGSSKVISIVITGPGLTSNASGVPSLNPSVADTFTYRVLDEWTPPS